MQQSPRDNNFGPPNLPKDLAKELRDYSKETMIPISKIVEKAICEYLKSVK